MKLTYDLAELVECQLTGSCSVTCGGGVRTCNRICNNGVFGVNKECPASQELNSENCNPSECRKFQVSYVKINKDLQFFPLNDVKLNWWTVKSKDLVLVNVAEACDFVHEFVTTELLALVWNVQLTKKLNLWDVTNINVGTLS